jgi:poly(3-hydroxybutyrate) depolymerase
MKSKKHLLCPVILFLAALASKAQPTLQFAPTSYTVVESAGSITLIVQRVGDTNGSVGVDFATVDGTATNGLKYIATNGTLSFATGETNQSIGVPILDDGLAQGTKTFRVTLSNATGGAVLGVGAQTNATVSILDNDQGLQFQLASYSVAEDAGAAQISIVRGDNGNLPVTLNFSTFDSSATNGLDYTGTNCTLSFAPQERLKFVHIPILNNNLKQPNRTFKVNLANPTNATLGTQKTASVTIVDNDQGFQFASAAYTVAEDAGAALISVLRGTDDTNSTVTVNYDTFDGSATNGLDYTGSSNELSFAPGEKIKLLSVPIINNGIKQSTRSFTVTLSNPSGGSVLGSPMSTTVSILDNDPGVGFDQTLYTNAWGDTGGITLTVVRGNDFLLGPITVDFATSDSTALAGQDYQATNGTLAFQENETVKSFVIPILQARPAGAARTFRVSLSNATGGATLGSAVTTVNIVGAYSTVAPPFETGLTIESNDRFNTLTWEGGGQLQRADSPTGPWQTLPSAHSPTTVQSSVPTTFYRVARPRPTNFYVPSSYDGQTPMPLVVLLHEYGASGSDVENYVQLLPLAETRGFLYCYPDSTKDPWGKEFWNSTDASAYDSGTNMVDDAGYLRSLIEQIGTQFKVDGKRVHLVGHSNGGFMCYRMACESADLIAGIASMGGMTFLETNFCQPSERVNILHIHGTADQIVPYGGGALTTTGQSFSFPANMPPFPSVLEDVQTWAGYNGASGLATDPAPSLDLTSDVAGRDTVITRYTNSPPGGAVELWTVLGGVHTPTLSSEFSPLVIDWLLSHPKP